MSAPLDKPDASEVGPPTGSHDWEKAQAEPEFQELRRRLRNFVFPVAALFLVWYLLYVVLSVYAKGFMATPLFDSNVTVGLVFGLLQFVSTFAITAWYVRFANKRLDPLSASIREELEQK
jgi:uncharacterized membrane protein (DUF485 family)